MVDGKGITHKSFLSTPSVRRATFQPLPPSGPRSISIHALREEGDKKEAPERIGFIISIHALREEGD